MASPIAHDAVAQANVSSSPARGSPAMVEGYAPGQGAHDAIEADNDSLGDADSAIGLNDVRSFTTSLASSIYDYTYENGRRYHAYREGEYLFPNDDTEQNRLDMLHHIFKLVLRGNLHKAPIESSPHKVLDFGTGTGIWAIDFADEYPSAEVIGNDLSPIQPDWVPANCKFIIDDVESAWPDDEYSHYDFIHGRNMSGSIGNWEELFSQALKALRPGGWLEMQEFDVWFRSEEGELPADSAIAEWQKHLDTASLMFGKRLNVANEFERKMIDVGFEDVRDDVIKVPIGAWPRDPKLKEQGRWLQAQMLDSIEPISLGYCTRILKWSETKTQVFMAGVRNEFLNNRTHLFVYCHITYGRRPESADA
ncbi:methyltransferase [Phlyctema vagabunda]|uniref:Methyltransferase n=1 Tax=Phlyctema vagabunda TaxID=108571 RepID=A0ABR4P9S5_9HELO